MKPSVSWSLDALEDLDNIWDYIAKDNPIAATDFIEELKECAESIPDIPKKGRIVRNFQNKEFREVYHKGYTILYEYDKEKIVVHEVFNQKRVFLRNLNRD